MEFPDVMLDLETTGLGPERNAIIQISAVRFNLHKRTIDTDFFDRCLMVPENRTWDGSTLEWWRKMPDVMAKIQARSESDIAGILQDLITWTGTDKTFWSKPTHFDHSFISSYFRDYNKWNPFHFRKANDMNTFIRARYYPDAPPEFERDLPFVGEKHNALFDCLHQIKVLFAAMDNTATSVIIQGE